MSAICPISYLFHSLPEAKCISLSYNLLCLSTKLNLKVGLVLVWGLKRRASQASGI